MGNMNDRRNSGSSHSVDRGGEIARMKAGTQATMAELQEFLGEVRGKSPQQVLGLVAASGLTQGIVMSTLATAVVLLAFTAVPYMLYGNPDADQAAKKAAAAATEAKQAEEQKAAEEEKAEPTDEEKKAAKVKAMTEELEQTKGAKGDEMPDIDDLLK